MTDEQLKKIIEILETMRKKPGLFTGDGYNANSINHYLNGLRLGLEILAIDYHSRYWEIAAKYGWKKLSAEGVVRQLQAKGVAEKKIIKILVDIEIEVITSYLQPNEKEE